MEKIPPLDNLLRAELHGYDEFDDITDGTKLIKTYVQSCKGNFEFFPGSVLPAT